MFTSKDGLDIPKKRHAGDAMKATDVPLEPTHRWEWLKYQLRVRGSSLIKLADELGVVSSAVKDAKHRQYPRVERAIANKIGLAPCVIWPERWNSDGTPHRQRPGRSEANLRRPKNAMTRAESNVHGDSAHRQVVTGA
ncbi:helix-turn-helix domain-containing protein [Salinicola lusitanus]|uniref:Helix-turn-helix domain-containing protein n=1 Tax=Salinicola lusitanus TaxID=1949085 RepID=A0ABZ3CYP5_9GAMM